MQSHTSVILGGVILVAASLNANAQQEPTGSWSSEQSGSNFYYGGGATDGTYLYLIAGYQPGIVSNQFPWYYNGFRRYDPAGDTWTTLTAPILSGYSQYALYGNAAAFNGGRLLSFGGYHYTPSSTGYVGGYSNAILAYSISDGTWSTLSATLSTPRYFLAASEVSTSLGDRIYVTGGLQGNGANDEFNPANDTITARAALPAALYYHAMATATVNGVPKVFAMTGYPGPTAACYEYTPPTSSTDGGSWATKAQVENSSGTAQARYAAKAFTVNNRIYLNGGVSGSYVSTTFEYNPATDVWTERASSASQHGYHAAATINGKGYVYGGLPTYTTGEEYTAPEFGAAPFPPAGLGQSGSRDESSLQARADPAQFDGWTNDRIAFSAVVTDPDESQPVRLRVQVKPAATSWTSGSGIDSLDSGLLPQGLISIPYTIPGTGAYDWRYRVEDSYLNSHPTALATTAAGWIEAFGTEAAPNAQSPDFRSDQETPADPVAVSPTNTDIQVPDPDSGAVTLQWMESTDNGPVSGISYELQVAREGGFIDVEAQLFSTAGTSSYPVTLSVSRFEKFWRIRARDVGGNFSQWSPPLTFRVTYNDGENHGSGDAGKTCGFAATPGGSPGGLVMLGLSILAVASRRSVRRSLRL